MGLNGIYKVKMKTMGREYEAEYDLHTDDEGNLSGTLGAMGMKVVLQRGSVNGNEFEGDATSKSAMGEIPMKVTGTIDGDHIKGEIKPKIGSKSTFEGALAAEE